MPSSTLVIEPHPGNSHSNHEEQMSAMQNSNKSPFHRIYQAESQLTSHARSRMQNRSVSQAAIDAVLDYGRVVYTRGAVVYAIGRNEVMKYRNEGIVLSAYEGVQVVCAMDGAIRTVYRNRNFRKLRTGIGRGRFRPRPRRYCVSS